jgi:hypothetical protein
VYVPGLVDDIRREAAEELGVRCAVGARELAAAVVASAAHRAREGVGQEAAERAAVDARANRHEGTERQAEE